MDYRELSPPEALRPLIKTMWTLSTGGGPKDRFRHVATPDGCIEIIHRLRGRSFWNGEQPPAFVAGLISAPVELLFSGGASFVGLRIWPWTWNAMAAMRSPLLLNRWIRLEDAAPGLAAPASPDEAMTLVAPEPVAAERRRLGETVLAAQSVGALVAGSGRPLRWLQRWFSREIGVPPRTYLRLLRFQDAFANLSAAEGTLAHHAAGHGYADQAHMAREFRTMAGVPASRAKCRAQPPFL